MRADPIHHTNTVRRFIIAGGRRHYYELVERKGSFCGPGQANGQRSAREEPNSFYERSRVERDLGHRSGPTVADSEAIWKRLAGDHIGLCTLVNSLSRHLLERDFWPGLPFRAPYEWPVARTGLRRYGDTVNLVSLRQWHGVCDASILRWPRPSATIEACTSLSRRLGSLPVVPGV